MRHLLMIGGMAAALSGCATVSGVADRFGIGRSTEADGSVLEAPADPFIAAEPSVTETALSPATAAPPPPVAAQTAEALDTTTAEQRAAATAPAAAPTQALGTTIVSLGSPTEPGLWMKTPLVSAETQGRVTNPANGKSSLVTLIPIDGPKTGGSRMSLPALRLIDASLTDLTEVQVALAG